MLLTTDSVPAAKLNERDRHKASRAKLLVAKKL
jgi:hypothetical protein